MGSRNDSLLYEAAELKFYTLQHQNSMFSFQLWTLLFFSGITSALWKALESIAGRDNRAVFSFLYLKKISKIYVRFGNFQKYTPVALWGATGLKCIFFLQICNKVPGEKKGGPVAPPPTRATGSGRLYKASPSFPPLI